MISIAFPWNVHHHKIFIVDIFSFDCVSLIRFNIVSSSINLGIISLALSNWMMRGLACLHNSYTTYHIIYALNSKSHSHHICLLGINFCALPNMILFILRIININLSLGKLLPFSISFSMNIWSKSILLFVFVI